MALLPVPDREVLLLVCVEGVELESAAAVLGISYAAVRTRLTRARKRLAQALAQLDKRGVSNHPEGAESPATRARKSHGPGA